MTDEKRFAIGDKAEKLYFKVFDVTTDRKHYPIKYNRLVKRLQDTSLDIYGFLTDANSSEKQERYKLQTQGITRCNQLASLLKYSLHAKLISAATCEELIDLVHDVKFMSLAWRKVT